MKRASFRPALLAAVVLLAVRPAWAVPLKELTEDQVRAWASAAVKAYRADPARADFWTELDALVVIDPNRIVYEQEKGVPVRLVWQVTPVRVLTEEERRRVQVRLRGLSRYVFVEHEKGLVAGPDVEVLRGVERFEIAPNPAPVVVEAPGETERLRRELEAARAEVERLRAPRRYVLVVQPSSMIYYDCASHSWLPGPASVVYYPAGEGVAPGQPRPPVLPPPAPTEPPVPPPPPPAPESKAGGVEAGRVFWVGYRSYWQGDYDRALAGFDAAVRLDAQDARFWYYKALAERALGHAEAAEASARRGRELHAALKPKAELVDAALERVQGQERRFLNAPQVIASNDTNDR